MTTMLGMRAFLSSTYIIKEIHSEVLKNIPNFNAEADMAKMKDLGYKYKDHPIETKSSENETNFPSLYLSEKVPAEILQAEVGDILEIKAKVKVTSKSIDEGIGESSASTRLDFMKMGVEERVKGDTDKLGSELKRQLKK